MSAPSPALLSIGFILVPNFTMLALAGFIDTLRLAGDEGDRSRQVDCRWTVMTRDGAPVTASNGLRVAPDDSLIDPASFDYLVVVGGTMHNEAATGADLFPYLSQAAKLRVPLVGICTGGFILARAGLMRDRKCCISWFHRTDMELEFPDLEVVADRLFVIDRDRITCAGGTSVIHLASHLVEQHLGFGRASKGLHVMLEDKARDGSSSQPLPLSLPDLPDVSDARVRRAMLMIDHHLASPKTIEEVAHACGITKRQLNRLFTSAVGLPPSHFQSRLRLNRASDLITKTRLPLTQIAFRCGFADASHLSRCVRKALGKSPSSLRANAAQAPA